VVRLIAFYLPQFHPIPENDRWWGKGFTDWRNVVRARPRFRGHYQPHIPADLGFYDLRLCEVREAQAELAREYGIHGFCYYHYWFHGTRVLNRPIDDVLASKRPDFPFCLCWANENWTRRWDGHDEDVLIKQEYSESDDRDHIRWLARVFEDNRYIRIDGKPLFLVYRANSIPDPLRTTSVWREEACKLGIGELFLCRVESNFMEERDDPTVIGFDAAVEFQPDQFDLPTNSGGGRLQALGRALGLSERGYAENWVHDYEVLVEKMVRRDQPPYRRFPCVTPSWDNSPRWKQSALIFHNSTPALYERWLRAAVQQEFRSGKDDGMVFINAWNEWAEGNHLEPDLRHGHAYLEATRRAVMDL
jgi:lipopolysaccharide biosynthesis protein